jgi:hypothetical protein
MGDGQLVPLVGIWNGEIRVANESKEGSLEVFDGKGVAGFVQKTLTLLRMFKIIHNYDLTTVRIPNDGHWTNLQN